MTTSWADTQQDEGLQEEGAHPARILMQRQGDEQVWMDNCFGAMYSKARPGGDSSSGLPG